MHPLERELLKLAAIDPGKRFSEFEQTVRAIQAIQAQAAQLGAGDADGITIPSLSPLNEAGWTPLMVAVSRGYCPYIQLLLTTNVDPCAEYKEDSALKRANLCVAFSSSRTDKEARELIEQAYLTRLINFGAAGHYHEIRTILNTTAACYLPREMFLRGIKIAMQDPHLETYEDKFFFALGCLSKKTNDKKELRNFVVEEFKAADIDDREILKLNWEMIKNSERMKIFFKKSTFSLWKSPWEELTAELDKIYKKKDVLLQNRDPASQTVNERRDSKQDNTL